MSGTNYMNSDRSSIKRIASKQGFIVQDYSPLISHENLIDDLSLANAPCRPKGELLQRRHIEGDIVMQLARTARFNPYGHGKKPKGFTTAAMMPYGVEEYAFPIGICEENFIPGNSPDDALKSVAVRCVSSLRLNAQRKGTKLNVDHGTTLIASFATYDEDRNNLIMFHNEAPAMSQWQPRPFLPMIEPIQVQSGHSIDSRALFDRAADTLMTNQQYHRDLKKQTYFTEENQDHSAVWDQIDDELVYVFSQTLLANNQLNDTMEKFVIGEGIRDIGSKDFRTAFAQQLHSTMASVVTTEDCINAQQHVIQLAMIMNWHLMRDNSETRECSRLYSATHLFASSVETLLALGQQNSEQRCRKIIGLALEHGEFKDEVDTWIQPTTHRI